MTDFPAADGFILDASQTVSLFSYLREREESLSPSVMTIYKRLSDHLYQRLSIDEIERPEIFLARIDLKP